MLNQTMTYWSPSWLIDQALHAKHDSSLLCKGEICFTFTFSLFVILQCLPSTFPLTPIKQTLRNFSKEENYNLNKCKIETNRSNIVQMLFLGVGLYTLLGLLYLSLCNRVRYVSFNTNLNLLNKQKNIPYHAKGFCHIFQLLCWDCS